MVTDEVESDLYSSDDEDIPFARHGPVIEPNHKEVTIQRDFWGLCAIGFILNYRKFFVNHLQQIINVAWRIRGNVTIIEGFHTFTSYVLSMLMILTISAQKDHRLWMGLYLF